MVVKNSATRREMPASLLQAIEGELTEAQLRELIAFEAEEIGLSFNEAIRAAREGTLPKNAIGMDLELLIPALPD
jgi:hypothetical protein